MDALLIEPLEPFTASVLVPGSKSLSNRALVLAALAQGRSELSGVLFSDDSRAMMDGLVALGYGLEIDEEAATVAVEGRGRPPAAEAELFCGNAGTAMRFLAALCCLGAGSYRLDGIQRMRERPIGELVDQLRVLGADIAYEGEEGFPPLRIEGAPLDLESVRLKIGTTLSSQYVSALLQIGPYLPEGLEVEMVGEEITSLPYLKMTLKLMRQFRVKSEAHRGYRALIVPKKRYRAQKMAIEPDASNASYFLAAAAVVPGSRCTVEGLGSNSVQGDMRFCELLGRMGCEVDQHLDRTTVWRPDDGRKLRGLSVDLNAMPDMAQTLAVVALFAEGPTTIANVGNLRVKETDRMEALRVELTKLGASVGVVGDDLTIRPPESGRITPAAIDTYDDHRMAMAFAVAGLAQPGVTINDPGCVNKTFPRFFEVLETLRG
ncbi:3-phosphoshikimate 1-carboxyvinyltransferase [Phycisphaera mikurensis]|uniref:3-phosphoshikimate 1-carboxyvinyltransferase n=1 Tax=Phycisphaera mikurensis (strain NBRC 102666 / KCTC 22515 / FYK2301M01) TaxID=1142394 RepID=I0IE63_PHYMF|nr:3-phosphoshikimate 1-carboxyvinyltransferase [Phycisphaera mikurensis]MBB6441355.1 3-phosphoshikimate 1-carboxyvinyltransferase [Phycisphaera mikurensis]BAM03551.1 3-phosphoshikimate 1-carboxyvinyltransferase [Phycisphaera mikurensis NBRC 102666]